MESVLQIRFTWTMANDDNKKALDATKKKRAAAKLWLTRSVNAVEALRNQLVASVEQEIEEIDYTDALENLNKRLESWEVAQSQMECLIENVQDLEADIEVAADFLEMVLRRKRSLIKAWRSAGTSAATESQRRDGALVAAGMEIVARRCAGPSEIDGSAEVVDVVQCSAGEIDSSSEIVGVVQYVKSEIELADNESMLDCMYEQSVHSSVVQTCTPLSSGQIWADLKADIKQVTQEAVLKLFVWTRAPPVLCACRDGNMCLVDFSCISKDRSLVGGLSVHGLYLFVPDPPWNYLVQFPTVNRPTTSVTSHTMIVRVCTGVAFNMAIL